jgi:hypothetical protein
VAELAHAGRFGVFDPDLSAYYLEDNGNVADVAALEGDTTLITNPRNPVLPGTTEWPAYSAGIAAIYGTSGDNRADEWNISGSPPTAAYIRLPPGGSLVYPGVWTGAPQTTGGGGAEAPVFANMLVTLPGGWTGVMQMPLVLKAMRGSGRVRVGTAEYEIGSTTLDTSLAVSPNWIPEIEVLRSDGPIELVFLLNPLRFGALDISEISVTGTDVWGLDIQVIDLAEPHRRTSQPSEQHRKPLF